MSKTLTTAEKVASWWIATVAILLTLLVVTLFCYGVILAVQWAAVHHHIWTGLGIVAAIGAVVMTFWSYSILEKA